MTVQLGGRLYICRSECQIFDVLAEAVLVQMFGRNVLAELASVRSKSEIVLIRQFNIRISVESV